VKNGDKSKKVIQRKRVTREEKERERERNFSESGRGDSDEGLINVISQTDVTRASNASETKRKRKMKGRRAEEREGNKPVANKGNLVRRRWEKGSAVDNKLALLC
jgi:hypothetical protein